VLPLGSSDGELDAPPLGVIDGLVDGVELVLVGAGAGCLARAITRSARCR
jgi:hypothetical protein